MIINNLVEMHSHILPSIDDGARDVEMSLKMIERLKEQGATKILLTPHYYSDTISLDDFLRKREKSFNSPVRFLSHGQRIQFIRKQLPLLLIIYHQTMIKALADKKVFTQRIPQFGRNEETTLVVQRMPVFTQEHFLHPFPPLFTTFHHYTGYFPILQYFY